MFAFLEQSPPSRTSDYTSIMRGWCPYPIAVHPRSGLNMLDALSDAAYWHAPKSHV